MNILEEIIKEGKIPEVPITIPNKSLLQIGLTIGIVGVILILSTYLLFKVKK